VSPSGEVARGGNDGDVLLAARDLAVGYHAPILRNVDVTIRRGDCVALVGANGSGKTTLFRTLLAILPPLAGTITYGAGANAPAMGRQATTETARPSDGGDRRRPTLGYVPQRDSIDTTLPLTVLEIVRMGAYRRWQPFGGAATRRRARVAAALATVGATGWERRLLTELSGGERQRVLIARALIADPDLLFLDEPTTGIDLASEAAIYADVERCRAAGLGILMVSHDLEGLCRVATRALVIRDGRIVELTGAPLDPERVRVALGGRLPGV